jgi:hypothetical protein
MDEARRRSMDLQEVLAGLERPALYYLTAADLA